MSCVLLQELTYFIQYGMTQTALLVTEPTSRDGERLHAAGRLIAKEAVQTTSGHLMYRHVQVGVYASSVPPALPRDKTIEL